MFFKAYLVLATLAALFVLAQATSATPPQDQIIPRSITGDMLGAGTVHVEKVSVSYDDAETFNSSSSVSFYHLEAGALLLDVRVVIREAFDDSIYVNERHPTISNAADNWDFFSSQSLFSVADTFSEGLLPVGTTLPLIPVLADPGTGADLRFSFQGLLHGDGTQGIADVYLLIGTP